jgi:hypothetical protein
MQFSDLPFREAKDDYIGPAERRGPHNMKELTEVTGGGVFTARHEEDLPRIVRTIGQAIRYRYVLTYKPVHGAGLAIATRIAANPANTRSSYRFRRRKNPRLTVFLIANTLSIASTEAFSDFQEWRSCGALLSDSRH